MGDYTADTAARDSNVLAAIHAHLNAFIRAYEAGLGGEDAALQHATSAFLVAGHLRHAGGGTLQGCLLGLLTLFVEGFEVEDAFEAAKHLVRGLTSEIEWSFQ